MNIAKPQPGAPCRSASGLSTRTLPEPDKLPLSFAEQVIAALCNRIRSAESGLTPVPEDDPMVEAAADAWEAFEAQRLEHTGWDYDPAKQATKLANARIIMLEAEPAPATIATRRTP